MSRFNFEGKNFGFAVGVDHVTSVFLQIWEKPVDDQDGCFLNISGRNLNYDRNANKLPKQAMAKVLETASMLSNGQCNYLGFEQIMAIIQLCDEFDDIDQIRTTIYDILD